MRMAGIRTLSRLALQGASGRDWYRLAASDIQSAAATLGTTPERLAGLLAVFSPRVSVRRSVRWAIHYIRTGGQFPHDCTRSHRAAVLHYDRTGEIRGPKTGPFARALLGDSAAVVLDVWMSVAFGIDQKAFERVGIHRECTRRIRRTAKLLGWTPAETQAAIWFAVVRNAGRSPVYLSVTAELSLFDSPSLKIAA